MNRINTNKGLTLIELILVLVIAATLIIIGINIYLSKRDHMLVKQDVNLINQLKKTTHTMTLNQSNYAGIREKDYYNDKNISKRYKMNGNLVNAQHKNVKVKVGSGSWANSYKDKLSFTMKGYSHYACTKILGLVGSKFYSTQVNGTTLKSKSVNGLKTSAFNMAKVASDCKSSNNTITFNMVKILNSSHLREVDNSLKVPARNQAMGVTVNNKSKYKYQLQRQRSALAHKP